MEGLIHHFKLVTEGIRVPAGQVLHRGGVTARRNSASTWCPTGGTRPYRVHYRDPSFH